MNHTSRKKTAVILIVYILLLILIFIYPLFNNHLVYGYDSPYYLISSAKIQHELNLLGTQVPILLPALIASLSTSASLSILSSLKITVLLLSCVVPVTVFLFAKKNFDTVTGIFSIFWVLISPTFYRLTSDLFNNLISEMFMILSFFVSLLKLKNAVKYTISGLLLALAFWSHTLTPLVGVAIYLLDGLVKLFATKKVRALIHNIYIILVGVFFSAPQSLPFLFRTPTGPNDPEFYITPLLSDSGNKFMNYILNVISRPQTILDTLNVFGNALLEWISPIIILFTLGGIFLLFERRKFSDKSLLLSAFVVPLALTLLSSTGSIGFTDRFIQYIFFPTAILSSYFLTNISKFTQALPWLKTQFPVSKVFVSVLFILIMTNTYPKYVSEVLARTPTISNEDHGVYKATQKYITPRDLVLINNFYLYWFKEANQDYNISIYEYFVTQYVANEIVDFGYYNPKAEYATNAYYVAKNSPLSFNQRVEGLCSLRANKNADRLFIFINMNEPGVDVDYIRNHPEVFLPIFNNENHYLFLLNNSDCLIK